MIVGATVTHVMDGSVVIHVPRLRESFNMIVPPTRALVKNQFIKIDISDDERTCRLA